MTRADKFEEIFGYRPATDQILCNEHGRCGENDACNYCMCNPNNIAREEDWWYAEYKSEVRIKMTNEEKIIAMLEMVHHENCFIFESLTRMLSANNEKLVDSVDGLMGGWDAEIKAIMEDKNDKDI